MSLARRRGDPKHPGPVFTLGQILQRWPIHVGLLIALIVVAPITIINLVQWQRISNQNQEIQKNRVAVSSATCRAINLLSRADNGQTVYIEGLILAGPEASRAFEPLIRRYGGPPYPVRKAEAEHTAKGLRLLSLPSINCRAFVDAIRDLDTRPEAAPFIIPYDSPEFPVPPPRLRAPGAGH